VATSAVEAGHLTVFERVPSTGLCWDDVITAASSLQWT